MANRSADSSDADIFRRYLDEIGEHQLLSAADEVALATRLLAGREAEARLESGAHILPSEKRQLRRTLDDAAAARRVFIQSNLRLVVSVARRYERSGLDMLDLVQEGNLGLMKAVEKFDHTKGFKFSTYATWWIRQSIGRAIADGSRTIRVPSHVRDLYSLIDQSTDKLAEELDRTPTPEEVSDHSGVSAERIKLARQHRRPLVSLSTPIGEDGDAELGDTIADSEAVAPYDAAAAALDRLALNVQLDRLKPRERAVLRSRFGLDGPPLTLAQIGETLEITRERVRQIEARGMGKLRHPSVSKLWNDGQRRPAPVT